MMKLNVKIGIETYWDELEQVNKTHVTFDQNLKISEILTVIELANKSITDNIVKFGKENNITDPNELFKMKFKDLL